MTDARREARKAFLALSSNGARELHETECFKSDDENEMAPPANGEVNCSQRTPVSNF